MNLSSDYGWLSAVLSALLAQTPSYLIYLVGIVIALMYLKKHSKIALYTIVSIGISLSAEIVWTFIQVLLPSYLIRQGISRQSIGYYFFGLGIASNLIHAVAFSLLLLAIFSGRANTAPKQLG